MDEWSKVKQDEYCGNEHGARIEVNVPGCQETLCSRRVIVGDPCVQVIQAFVKQESRPVDQEGDDKVDPSPSPVHCQAFPYKRKVFFWLLLLYHWEWVQR